LNQKKPCKKSVALINGRHFLVKDLFDDKSDEYDDGEHDTPYNDKFHRLKTLSLNYYIPRIVCSISGTFVAFPSFLLTFDLFLQ
jgi:hypothetical protein